LGSFRIRLCRRIENSLYQAGSVTKNIGFLGPRRLSSGEKRVAIVRDPESDGGLYKAPFN
jgi:hypothetical protein